LHPVKIISAVSYGLGPYLTGGIHVTPAVPARTSAVIFQLFMHVKLHVHGNKYELDHIDLYETLH
jgi:hypothetical protein